MYGMVAERYAVAVNDRCSELVAVIVHAGVTASTGHYIAYVRPDLDKLHAEQRTALLSEAHCRDCECQETGSAEMSVIEPCDKWLCLDDERVSVHCQQHVLDTLHAQQSIGSAYVLLYQRMKQ